jgi:dipeptidyl aminopeptidase/acylaminoacyl peptidase
MNDKMTRVAVVLSTSVILTSCNSFQAPAKFEVTNIKDPTLIETDVISPLPTMKPSSVPTSPQVSLGRMPDILLNLGTDGWWECDRDGTNQIWFSAYPYHTSVALLHDDSVDYNYPTWSPDGEWVAYVHSEPITEIMPKEVRAPSGTDSIWIMRADGSDRRRVTDMLPRINYLSPDGGCMAVTFITSNIVWSPDSKFIAFSYQVIGESITYYLVDLASGETSELMGQQGVSPPVWVDQDEMAITDDAITVYEILSNHEINSKVIQYPDEIPDDALFGFSNNAKYQVQVSGRSLISSFFILETVKSRYHSTWQVNIDTSEWIVLIDQPNDNWGNPIIGDRWAAACGLDWNVYSINPLDWNVIDIYVSPTANLTCQMLDVLQDDTGQDIVSYPSNEIETRDGRKVVIDQGLYIAVLTSGELDPQLLVALDTLEIYPQYSVIVDYSWRIISD